MIYRIMLFLLWAFVWLLLSWPPNAAKIVTAMIVSIFVSLLTADILTSRKGTAPKKSFIDICARISWFFWYVVVFLWECLKANIDVAYRVLHPDLPIRPGTVKIKTNLKSDIALTFLANSLTLTPGRTTIDIDKERGFIYIHKLYIRKETAVGKVDAVEKFENILGKIFE